MYASLLSERVRLSDCLTQNLSFFFLTRNHSSTLYYILHFLRVVFRSGGCLLENMGFRLTTDTLILLSVLTEINEFLVHKGTVFFLLHTFLFLGLDRLDLLEVALPQQLLV